jgi:hypothetical protein
MSVYYGTFNGSQPISSQLLTCLSSPSTTCDTMAYNFCALNQNSVFCACINSPFPCSATSDPQCSNNPNAYKLSATPYCTDALICNNVAELSGNSNIADFSMLCTNSPNANINLFYVVLFIIFMVLINFISAYIWSGKKYFTQQA